MEDNKEKGQSADQEKSPSKAQLERKENESPKGNDYADDQGEDENGQKPSADDQD